MKFDQKNKVDNKFLCEMITAGCAPIVDKTIVHTAPHHDDIVLSYHAYAMRNMFNNRNHIVYATSGANGVTDAFILRVLCEIDQADILCAIKLSYHQVLNQFVQAYRDKNYKKMFDCKKFIMVKLIAEIFACSDNDTILNSLRWLITYFRSKRPGQKDISEVIELKGRIRESESDRKWMVCKGDFENVTHLRSAFYHAQDQTIAQAMESDVARLVEYLKNVQPDIITVALDPFGIGPKNHYVTLQLVARAVARLDNQNIKIIGYRNIWSTFSLEEASMIVPITQDEMDMSESIFLDCFATQKNSIFVATDSDGVFSKQTQQIHRSQWQQVKTILGADHGNHHESSLIRDAVGAIFLKILTVNELLILAACSNL